MKHGAKPQNGWIILDKPSGLSSARAVSNVKRLLQHFQAQQEGCASPATSSEALAKEEARPIRLRQGYGGHVRKSADFRGSKIKIGHAGTLDPLASGVLPLALGEATKTVAYMMDGAKAYEFTVQWGEGRDTDDSQGQVTGQSAKRPSNKEILDILHLFIGDIDQMPPQFSALNVDGKRAYALAREGKQADLKPRRVHIDSLAILDAIDDEKRETTSFICHCGKGTYIRSLARDMGTKLGCLGHITVLRRIKVGKFTENHAISLDLLEELVHKGDLSFLLAVESALDDIPALEISSSQATQLQQGKLLPWPGPSHETALVRCEGTAVALCRVAEGTMKPLRVFNLK